MSATKPARVRDWLEEATRLDAEAQTLRAPHDAARDWRGPDGEFYPAIKLAGEKAGRASELRDLAELCEHLESGEDPLGWFQDILGNGCEVDTIYSPAQERTLASMIPISRDEAHLLDVGDSECAVIWHSETCGDSLEFGTLREWKVYVQENLLAEPNDDESST